MMPDPLTVLLDAIWIEAQWQEDLAWQRVQWILHGGRQHPQDSISGRNVFWVSVMEGKE